MRSSATIGFGLFLLLAPLVAVVRQAAVLAMAGLVGAATNAVEAYLLPLLPVDPVYGGAGLRVLGGIEARGLAVAGPIGEALHWLLPALFGQPHLVAPDAIASALVGPGVTVLARVMTALLSTMVLVAVVGGTTRRLRRPAFRTTALLIQVWLLLDLAHETDLGARDLEATGLPFALAAFAPVDAQGQRVLLTTHLDGLPPGAVALATAVLTVGVCLLGALLLRGAARLALTLVSRRLSWPRLAWPSESMLTLRLPRLAPTLQASRAMVPRAGALAAVTMVAALVSISPLGTLAEGELVVLAPLPLTTAAPEPVAAAEAISDAAPAASEPSVAGEAVVAQPSAPAMQSSAPSGQAAASQATISPPAAAPSADAPPPPPAPPTQPAQPGSASGSVVAVEGRGYQYTLRVNGRPTVIRGMGYNPWYASLPSEERQQRYRRDFSAMQEIGVNTLEGWFQNQFDEITLDEAQRQGLRVIMPFELNQDYDYSDPAVKAMFRQQVTEWVLRYKDHPAVLMWGPGNEVMHRLIFPTAVQGVRDPAREQRANDFAAFYVELIDLIRSLDPNHPVVYRDAEDLYFARLRASLLRDGVRRPWFIYGTNVYTQRIADVIERWPTQGLDAPLLISEFSPGGSGTSERPNMLGWYWSTIRAHPKRVIGGVVYTWTTRGPEDLDRVFGLTDESGAPVDGSVAALRQLFRADETTARAPGRPSD